ncbi:MAG: ATP-grasp domain-containing protein [Arcobacter sp.]|uniref:ATP-grasp domain-containing protein n=1 Tax=Arcobacter sp. TaxID=1872629 RepID=UPI003B00FD8C
MKRIFFTVANNSSTVSLFSHLNKNNYEIYAGDLNPDSIGKFYCKKFIILPRQDSEEYIPALLEIVKKEKIDIIIPSGELECYKIAQEKSKFTELNCIPVVTNLKTLETSLDKADSYNYLTEHANIPFMKYHLIENINDLEEGLIKLKNYELSIKPSQGSGSRGFAFLTDEKVDAEHFFNSKNTFPTLSVSDLKNMLTNSSYIPKLILMEKLEGTHYDSNMICSKGKVLFQSVRTREEAINGTITKATVVRNEEIFEINRKIAETLNVEGYICTQYIGDKLIEINPRWSTSINYDDFNEYLMVLDYIQGKELKVTMADYDRYIDTKFIRYFNTFEYKN